MADFLEKVSFANKISTVLKATSDDETPIPGYLYKDICDISFESDGSSLCLVEFLTDRLEKKSPNVKLKVLKLLKYVVEHGHPKFGHCLRKDATGISEATKYGGVDDVLKGKAQIHAIRMAAQELSECLFDAEGSLSSKKETPQMKSTGGMGSAQTGSKMQGFGNSPALYNKTIGDTIIDGLSKLADKLSDDSESQKRALLSSMNNPTGLYNPIQLEGESHVIPAQKTPVPKATPPRHIPGRAGGGWEDEEPVAPSVSGPWTQKSAGSKSTGSEELSDRLDSLTIETPDAWLVEQELVTTILQSSTNPLPPRTEINSFLKSCTALNCDKIVEFLNRQLSSCDDTVVMRCLLIIEAVMRSDLFNLEQLVTVIEPNLIALYNNGVGMVKAKSRKIIRILEKLTSHTQILTSNIVETNGLILQSLSDKTLNSSSCHVSQHGKDIDYSNADGSAQQSSYEPPFLLCPDMEETESMSNLLSTGCGTTDFLKPET